MGWLLLIFFGLFVLVIFTNLHKPTREHLEKCHLPGGALVALASPFYAPTIEKILK